MKEQDDMTTQKQKGKNPSPSDEQNGGTKALSKTEKTIEQLSQLLNSCPSAEELASSWYRESIWMPKNQRPSSIQPHQPTTNLPSPKLSDLHTVLNSGRSITRGTKGDRGIPLWIIVRMCKASWHLDGTWPLIGCDESEKEEDCAKQQQQSWKSIHPSSQILKTINLLAPNDANPNNVPSSSNLPIKDIGPPIRNEATADEIAEAYRRRGIHVEDAPKRGKEDDW